MPLHHNYVLVELFSADCFPVLINILQVGSHSLVHRPLQADLSALSSHRKKAGGRSTVSSAVNTVF